MIFLKRHSHSRCLREFDAQFLMRLGVRIRVRALFPIRAIRSSILPLAEVMLYQFLPEA